MRARVDGSVNSNRKEESAWLVCATEAPIDITWAKIVTDEEEPDAASSLLLHKEQTNREEMKQGI